jgi:hypothetical protein
MTSMRKHRIDIHKCIRATQTPQNTHARARTHKGTDAACNRQGGTVYTDLLVMLRVVNISALVGWMPTRPSKSAFVA